MIVTCPSCNSRYKIDEAKIKGRGAKITCPTCAHKFVVYRDGDEGGAGSAVAAPDEVSAEASPAPSDLARRDFREVGITWKVRKGIGLTYDFHDLSTLRDYLADGQVHPSDVLSYDARAWHPLKEIPDLERYFWDVWRRAEAGEIQVAQPIVDESDDEDESDAPTTIVGHGSSLADEIRQAVKEATTPAPAARRTDTEKVLRPAPQAAQTAPAPPAEVPVAVAAQPAPVAAPNPGAPAAAGQRSIGMLLVLAVAAVALLAAVMWALGMFDGLAAQTGSADNVGATVALSAHEEPRSGS